MTAFDAIGPGATGTSATTSPLTWSHTCTGTGLALVVYVAFDNTNAAGTTSCTYTKGGSAVAMTSLGKRFSGGGTAGYIEAWTMAAPDPGAHTVTVTWSGNGASVAHGGSVSFTGASGFGTAVLADSASANVTSASITIPSTTSGGIVIGGVTDGSDTTAFTAGTQRVNCASTGGGAAGDLAIATVNSTGGATSVSWTQASDWYGAIAVEVLTAAAAGPAPVITPTPALPPSPFSPPSFRGMTRQVLVPASVPGLTLAPAGPATAAVTAPDPVAVVPTQAPAGLAAATAVAPSPTFGTYITGLGTSASIMGYFSSPSGPALFIGEDNWGLIANAGAFAFSGHYLAGDWQGALDTYFSQRAAQGYNVVETSCFSNNSNNNAYVFTTGQDWDGTWPFTSTNDPSSGLNNTFWARRDYMFSSAAANGFTVMLSVSGSNIEGTGAGNMPRNWTTAQWQALGTALGNRYKSTPNVLWVLGDDYFDNYNTQFNAFITNLRAAGDNHAISNQYNQESTSRSDIVSGTKKTLQFAQFNWIYTYNPSYAGVDRAFAETVANTFSGGPVPSVWGDGAYVATGGYTGFATPQDYSVVRRMIWWALAEGARGVSTGDNDIYPWGNGSAAQVTAKTFYTTQVTAITAAIRGTTGWHLLEPDTGSTFVTAGRGTKYTGAAPYVTNTDSWVAASRTVGATSTLAIIYMPSATTITIDQTKMVTGYTATWVDPASGAKTTATPGTTYNSTAKGSNSVADTDWVLILQAPVTTSANAGLATATATAPGAPAGTAIAPNAGLAAATASAPSPVIAIAPAAGSAAAAAIAPGAPAGTAIAPNAGLATAAAAAPAPVAQIQVNAQLATAAAAAPAPGVQVTANAGLATASASAPQPSVSTSSTASAPAGLPAAAATAPAPAPAAAVSGLAGAAQAAAASPAPAAKITASAGLASAAAAAPAPVAQVAVSASAGLAAATATAPAPAPTGTVSVPAGLATAATAAPQPTISTSSNVTAPAGLATAAASAPAPAVSIQASAQLAATTASALAPAALIAPQAGLAIATASAPAATGQVAYSAAAGAAQAAASAPAPLAQVRANAGLAAATAVAPQPSVTTSATGTANAGLATAAAAALAPAIAIAAQAQLAFAAAGSPAVTVQRAVSAVAGLAAAAAAAPAASVTHSVTAGPFGPGSATVLAGGSGTWVNPGNVLADDGAVATWTVP